MLAQLIQLQGLRNNFRMVLVGHEVALCRCGSQHIFITVCGGSTPKTWSCRGSLDSKPPVPLLLSLVRASRLVIQVPVCSGLMLPEQPLVISSEANTVGGEDYLMGQLCATS